MQAKYGEKEIVVILQKLRIFNKSIGSYQGFALTEHFKYAVKLSNGRIILHPDDLNLDETNSLTPEQLRSIASRFAVDHPAKENKNDGENVDTIQRMGIPSKMRKVFSLACMLIVIVLGGLAMISKQGPATSKSANKKIITEKTAEQKITANKNTNVPAEPRKKPSLKEIEKQRPADFLSADGTYKGNLWGSKLKLDCVIKNSAKETTYRNAVLKVIYFNKDRQQIATEEYPLADQLPPASSKIMQLKINRYKKTESVELEIVKAVAL